MRLPRTGVLASATVLLWLVLAAFVAGVVDAIAGGGGLITLPALLAAGVPPHAALATNKGQSVFGSGTALFTFAKRGLLDRSQARFTFPSSLLGSLAGAAAVMVIPPSVLRPVVLVLLPVASLTLFIPRREHVGPPPAHRLPLAAALALTIGAYDGFFGPGTGTFLVIAFSSLLHVPLLRASADAKVVNFASNLAAVAIFSSHGAVLWHLALPMAVAQSSGSWVGAHLAIRGGDRVVRVVALLVVVGVVSKLALDWAH